MDEHGQKVAQAAAADRRHARRPSSTASPARFEAMWDRLAISRDQFIRTTAPAHQAGVQELIERIFARNPDDFYERSYAGCTASAARRSSRTPRSSTGSACCTRRARSRRCRSATGSSACRATRTSCARHIDDAPGVPPAGEPAQRDPRPARPGARGHLREPRAPRLGRALPAPDERRASRRPRTSGSTRCPTTGPRPASRARGATWPAELHVIGKDITRFHCVIWPAMLRGGGAARCPSGCGPTASCSSGGERFSKSAGVKLDLGEAIDRFGARRLPLLPAARGAVGRRRQLQLGALRGALHLRPRRRARQPRVPLARDDRAGIATGVGRRATAAGDVARCRRVRR